MIKFGYNGIPVNYKHFHINNVFKRNMQNTYKRYKTDSAFKYKFDKIISNIK